MENRLETAVVTLREAREQLSNMRKDRGFKGPGSGSGRGAGKGLGKKPGKCHACGAPGHWAGDADCPKGGGGRGSGKSKSGKGYTKNKGKSEHSEAHVVDLVSGDTTHETLVMDNFGGHEILMTEKLSEVMATRAKPNGQSLSEDKVNQAAVDSACNRSCAGQQWVDIFLESLNLAPGHVRDLVSRVPEAERFKFGNGGTLTSKERIRLPIKVLDEIVLVWVSVIPWDVCWAKISWRRWGLCWTFPGRRCC